MWCFSDEEECCHIVGRVNLGLANPLSKEIIGSWLYHMVSLRLVLRGGPKRTSAVTGDRAPVLKTSAQLLSGA